MPTQVDENFAVGDGMQVYEREIVVYQTLRSSLGLPLPEYLHGEMDPDPAPWLARPLLFLFDHLPLGGVNWVIGQFLKVAGKSKRRYILVLEDIADARPPSQLTGGSLDEARRALVVLARFHAHNWMRREVLEANDKIYPMNRAARVFQASYLRNREAFVERFGDAVGDDMLARLDEIQVRAPTISDSLAAAPWTLLHGDYRLDNVLFRPDDEIVVLDLQGVGAGRPRSTSPTSSPRHSPRNTATRRSNSFGRTTMHWSLPGSRPTRSSSSSRTPISRRRCWRTASSGPPTCSTRRSPATATPCST